MRLVIVLGLAAAVSAQTFEVATVKINRQPIPALGAPDQAGLRLRRRLCLRLRASPSPVSH